MPPEYAGLFAWTVLPLMVIRTAAFRAFRLIRERWRYASTRDVPLSIIGIEGVLTCWLTAGVWLTYRLSFEHVRRTVEGNETSRAHRRSWSPC